IARAFDTLFPISKKLSFKNKDIKNVNGVVLLPASRFFRPYSSKERLIQKFKIQRIKNEMTKAAQKGENYHLWWHPHNFGHYPTENMVQLKQILDHFQYLKEK